jgi:hypothetical protein
MDSLEVNRFTLSVFWKKFITEGISLVLMYISVEFEEPPVNTEHISK